MAIFPYLEPTEQTRLTVERFGGYDHRPACPEGSFYEMENLSSRHYPLLSTRPERGVVRELESPGGFIGKDALAFVDNGTLWYNGQATAVTGLTAGQKQLVGMGSYILIFPDKRYFNTENFTDHGSMEAYYSFEGSVKYSLCNSEGVTVSDPTVSDTEPVNPENGMLWMDGNGSLYTYSSAQGLWTEEVGVFTRLEFTSLGQIPALFSAFDGVKISGCDREEMNGEKVIYALGGGEEQQDYIVLAGLVSGTQIQENAEISISRTVPDMDFVCQCQNRLWGCRYGLQGGKIVNELYCSALGDFKNFHQYMGLSTDSWTASLGSDGQFTGAVSYLGSPCFFKEDRIHRVTVSAQGGHRVDETVCRGVQKGSDKSLCVVGESLYYKARNEICVWQGGFPQSVSSPLGDRQYKNAVAGALGSRYYVSMQDGDGEWSLFVYDSALSLWQREDSLHAACFTSCRGELYCIDADNGLILAMTGREGSGEGKFEWMAESGILRYFTPDRQYISRLSFTMSMENGGSAAVYLRYDGSGQWEKAGELSISGPGTVTLPVRPRRCGHMQLRLTGQGQMSLYDMSRVLEQGSDV